MGGPYDFSAVLNIKVCSLHIKSLLLIFGIKIVFGYFLLDKAKKINRRAFFRTECVVLWKIVLWPANFNKIIIPRQSSFVASLFTQQFTQHKSESGDVSVVALDLVNWSPVLSSPSGIVTVCDRTKVFSLSQSARLAAYWVQTLYQSKPGALTRGDRRAPLLLTGCSHFEPVSTNNNNIFLPGYTALAPALLRKPQYRRLKPTEWETYSFNDPQITLCLFSSSNSPHQRLVVVPGRCLALARARLTFLRSYTG